ncbi:MAG: portal protein [Bacilli bacterium]|nr:portal protein [Bacilli bacterium]
MNDNKINLNEVKVKPISATTPEIGIDTEKTFIDNILDSAQVGTLDLSSIDALTQSAQNREQAYQLIDAMTQDTIIAAVLETYAEDVVQTNDNGDIMWIEANDARVLNYTSWLLESLNVDKHLYQWAYCLVTYGDVYLRLFRKSDVEEDLLFKNNPKTNKLNESIIRKTNEPLTEEVKLKLYGDNDKYIPYIQMVDNPGEMFDLQKFGKTQGYIKAATRVIQQHNDNMFNYITRYKMKQSDVEIFDAMSFVHGCLETTSQRQPETVDIFLDSLSEEAQNKSDSMTSTYSVKRGQSILYNSFRNWRQLTLLEMSALLNRVTKSAVTRIITVDVGDMPKNQVQVFMQRLKDKLEQKTALDVGTGMAEYTNPAPIENTIYVPVHGTQGTISATTLGGDFDPKSLVDIEYFRDKLFGNLKVPKQFFGFTDDGAGFNGGTSLTILSSRYGKSIKNIQNILCQMMIDVINLFLIDRGLDSYVNKFRVRMQAPVTQEELDRRANNDNRLRYISDIMQQLSDIEDKIIRLEILKSLLGDVIGNPEVISYIHDYIDILKAKEEENNEKADDNNSEDIDFESDSGLDLSEPEAELAPLESFHQEETKDLLNETAEDEEEDSYLPTPEELGLDSIED